MAMQHLGTEQILPLWGLEQGQNITLVLTNLSGPCVLEFQHVTDPEWRAHPGFQGIPTNGVVVQQDIRCISGKMRVRFLTEPSETYYLSIVFAAEHSF